MRRHRAHCDVTVMRFGNVMSRLYYVRNVLFLSVTNHHRNSIPLSPMDLNNRGLVTHICFVELGHLLIQVMNSP